MTAVAIAQVEAALAEHPARKPVTFGALTLDTDKGVLSHEGLAPLTLQPMRAKLLVGLMLAPGGFLTHQAAYDVLYWDVGEAKEPEPSIVAVWACKLRRDLKPYGYGIQAVWGRGYQLGTLPA